MSTQSIAGRMLNKVPEVTIFFWIIKVLCTTVGETASDFLNVSLNLGLIGTSIVTGIALVIALIVQFKTKKYVPVIYWLNVMLISVFGTLVTDNLTDGIGFPLEYSTVIFSALLLLTFGLWYWQERTLSIHSIYTRKREAFYWLAVLFTFALGTATGDLYAEALGLGYATTGIIIAAIIAIFSIVWRLGLNPILSFWVIYIMTRPLGASIGDLLSQPQVHGGLGVGPTMTTIIFIVGIIVTVLYLSFTKRDVTPESQAREEAEDERQGHALVQVVVVAILFAVVAVGGYHVRQTQLKAQEQAIANTGAQGATGHAAPLGNVSQFSQLAQDIKSSVQAGDWAAANTHTNDLEYAWDQSEAQLKSMNPAAWTHVDDALDVVFRQVRAVHPNQQTTIAALNSLLGVLANP